MRSLRRKEGVLVVTIYLWGGGKLPYNTTGRRICQRSLSFLFCSSVDRVSRTGQELGFPGLSMPPSSSFSIWVGAMTNRTEASRDSGHCRQANPTQPGVWCQGCGFYFFLCNCCCADQIRVFLCNRSIIWGAVGKSETLRNPHLSAGLRQELPSCFHSACLWGWSKMVKRQPT